MNNNRVKEALNNTLSGLRVSDLEASILLAQAKGGKKVKNKLSVAMVLLITLIAISITAFAVISLQQYYEKTIEKEGNHGLIKGWKANDHIAFVDMMTDAGIKLNESKLAQMRNTSLSEEERGNIAWELIQEYYPARDGILTSVDVIAKEKGPVEYWSLEDKAWFSQMMLKYQPNEVGSINLLPTKEEISKEQAIEIMYSYFEKEYGLKRMQFDEKKMSISFSENIWNDGSDSQKLRTWNMDLWLKNDPIPLGISILPNGEIKQAIGPSKRGWQDDWYDTLMQRNFWTVDGLNQFSKTWAPKVAELLSEGHKVPKDLAYLASLKFSLPSSGDITLSQAQEKAIQAILNNLKWTEYELSLFGIKSAYQIDNPDRHEYKFVFTYWMPGITEDQIKEAEQLRKKGEIPFRAVVRVDAKTGEIIEVKEQHKLENDVGFGF
ncbi:MAG: hypothetical protein GYA87_05840 [Christensenellaceae bacterium]|nr:hypothetical protein [Christensenellaceae bacterium]